MIIKYYGFGKKLIYEEKLNNDTGLPENICGYEIYDENNNLINACFQGQMAYILDILEGNSPLNIFPEKIQVEYKKLAEKYYKENGTQDFIINVKNNNVSFQEVIPCEETNTYRTKEELCVLFDFHKHNILDKPTLKI